MSIDGIRAIAEKYQSKVTGKLGIGFIDLQTGEKYTLNGTELFPTASVCKVFTLAALYKMVAEGKADDRDRYEMTADVQVGGSGVLVRLLPGLNPTLYDYAMLMMILSDNTAADFLFKFVGGAEVAGTFASGGTYADQDATTAYGYLLAEQMNADYSIISIY